VVSGLEFRVLGPVQVLRDGEPLTIGGGTGLTALSGLLVSADQVVSVESLSGLVWDVDAPVNKRASLHTVVSRLRRVLGHDVIETHPAGYQLHGDTDLLRFGRLLEVAGAAAARDADEESLAALDEAIGLWRGSPLSNVESSELCRTVVPRLTERYLTAQERRAAIWLSLGRNDAVAEKLPELLQAHPFHERLVGLLMLALFRDGRQADALAAYATLRRSLREELGIDPGAELQDLHVRMLRSDPGLIAPPRAAAVDHRPPPPAEPVVPRQLPWDISDFTGRAGELARIIRVFTDVDETSPTSRIVVLAGRGGAGKTALAVHAAHRLKDAFPDGQLYLDLHGDSAAPLDAADALAEFLHALGVEGAAVPERLEQRAALYRSLVADRRLLVMLDNAASEHQIRPLIPGGAGCAVVATARRRLTGLPGASLIEVGVLDADHAADLLGRMIGVERVRAERDHAETLIRLAGGLPLALRVAGARLAAKPHWSLATLVERLKDAGHRLDEFSYDDLDVRAMLALSYHPLPLPAKTMLRRLGLLDAPDFPVWAGAALLDVGITEAEELFESLVDAQLLDVSKRGGAGDLRYRCHDLIRVYARERATAEEDDAELTAAVARAFGGWLALAESAHRAVYGGDYSILHGAAPRWRPDGVDLQQLVAERSLDWLEDERLALLAAIRQSAEMEMDELCWDLAWTATTLFETRGYFDDWRMAQEQALAVARKAGNRRGEAAMLTSLGSRLIFLQSFPEARDLCERAVGLFALTGDRYGHGLAQRMLGHLDIMAGRLDSGLRRFEEADRELREAGDRSLEAHVLRSMGDVNIERGDYEAARRYLDEALAVSAEIGSDRGEAQAMRLFGELALRQGHFDEAEDAFGRVLRFARNRDLIGETYALVGLGEALAGQGRSDRAEELLLETLRATRRLGQRLIEGRALLDLGRLDMSRGRFDAAAGHLAESLAIFEWIGTPLWQERSRRALAELDAVRDAP
jgi:DNA-binding SARP family transcriptional activator